MTIAYYSTLFGGLFLGLVFSIVSIKLMAKKNQSNKKTIDMAKMVEDGTKNFLKMQFEYTAPFLVAIFVAVFYFFDIQSALSFLIGAALSLVVGFVGPYLSAKIKIAAVNGVKEGGKKFSLITSENGLAISILICGGTILILYLFRLIFEDSQHLTAFTLGALLTAILSRIGSGICSKSADIGSDLTTSEASVVESDIRNPASTAVSVGDNISDLNGSSLSFFSIICTLFLAISITAIKEISSEKVFSLALFLLSAGLVTAIISQLISRLRWVKESQIGKFSTLINFILLITAGFFIVKYFINDLSIFYGLAIGATAALLSIGSVSYFVNPKYEPVQRVAQSAKSGATINLIFGFSYGLFSLLLPLLIILISIYFADRILGHGGIIILSLGALLQAALFLGQSIAASTRDSSENLAKISGLDTEVNQKIDTGNLYDNISAAMGRSYTYFNSSLLAIGLVFAYILGTDFKLTNPLATESIVGLILGGVTPIIFSAFILEGVGLASLSVIEKIKLELKSSVAFSEKSVLPDHKEVLNLSSKIASSQMIAPVVFSILALLVVGLILGSSAVVFYLTGLILSGLLFSALFSNSGAIWDNARKWSSISQSAKNNLSDKKTIIGDTLGDPFKDAVGPSLGILIIFAPVFSLFLASMFVDTHFGIEWKSAILAVIIILAAAWLLLLRKPNTITKDV